MREPRARRLATIAASACALGACSFPAGLGPDGVPPPGVGFQFPASITDETIGTHSVSVALATPAIDTATVDVELVGGTATEGADFTLNTTQLTFLAGQDRADVELSILGDGDGNEADETIELRLKNASNAIIFHDTHTVTISNTPLPRVAWAAPTSNANEPDTTQSFMITLTAPALVDVLLGCGVSGTASPGVDHDRGAANMVTIPAGMSGIAFPVMVVDDNSDEYNETIDLTLTAITGAVLDPTPGADQHSHTILDDDPPPIASFSVTTSDQGESAGSYQVHVTIAPASGKDVTVDFADVTPAGQATITADYGLGPAPGTLSFPPGVTDRAITVTPATDSLDENDEQVRLRLTAANNATVPGATDTYTMTILDDDATPTITFDAASGSPGEAIGTYNVGLTMTPVSGRDVQFSLTNTPGTATGSDYSLSTGPFTIPAGSTTYTVPVTITNDNSDEPDETFTLALGTLTNVGAGATTSHGVTIVDDDLPAVTVGWDPGEADGSANEGNGSSTSTYNYRLVLSAASAVDINVNLSRSGTANGADATVTPTPPTTITFTAGQTSKTVSVVVQRDNTAESDETVILTLSNPTPANAVLGIATRTHTILNDD